MGADDVEMERWGPNGMWLRPRIPKQKALNECWPYRNADGSYHARGIDNQPPERQLDVTVRVVFEHDGETWIEARAVRWTRTHVFVHHNDRRIPTYHLWVKAEDVRRR